MQESLAVLLPVRNAQATLGAQVLQILDVASDLTKRLEVLVIDDASHDGTEEAAWDLATRFAQVEYVRHPFRLGRGESIQTGINATRGTFILILEGEDASIVEQMVHLWRRRRQVAVHGGLLGWEARPDTSHEANPRWLQYLLAWGQAVRQHHGHPCSRLRLLHRRGAAQFAETDSSGATTPAALDSIEPTGTRRRHDAHQLGSNPPKTAPQSNRRHVAGSPDDLQRAIDQLKQGAQST